MFVITLERLYYDFVDFLHNFPQEQNLERSFELIHPELVLAQKSLRLVTYLLILLFLQLHFHGEDLQSLHQHIPAEELPEELGGSQGPLNNTFLLEDMKKHEDYFKGMCCCKVIFLPFIPIFKERINDFGNEKIFVLDNKVKSERKPSKIP